MLIDVLGECRDEWYLELGGEVAFENFLRCSEIKSKLSANWKRHLEYSSSILHVEKLMNLVVPTPTVPPSRVRVGAQKTLKIF